MAMGVNLVDFEATAYVMFAGTLKASPFAAEEIAKGKKFMVEWCESWGSDPKAKVGDALQEIDIRLLQAFLEAAGDPDAPALDCYASGVRLGHNRRMPRTPAVFSAKKKWRLGYEAPGNASSEWVPNYKSAKERRKMVEEKSRKI